MTALGVAPARTTQWQELALAVTAAYQHRVSAAHHVLLASGGVTLPLVVEPTVTVADLVSRIGPWQGRTATAEGELHVTVAGPGDADAAAEMSFVLLLDEDGRGLRIHAGAVDGRPPAQQLLEHADRLEHFARRLLAAGPGTQIGDVDLLTPTENERVMHEWNGTAHQVPTLTLPELVEASAAAHPDRPAVRHRDERLTYEQLENRANRLARLLIGRGAGPGDIVAMVLPRSVDFVVTALAVVKTGAAYLPVDTASPVERINRMLSDAHVSHVVTGPAAVDSVTVPADTVILDEATRAELRRLEPSAPADIDRRAPLTPDTPAYVLYTSGSTGRPKGVVVTHRAITNRLHHMQHQIPLGADDRLLQKTPAGFDVTVREVFWPLLAGATIVVADPDGHRDPAYLIETIRGEEITVTHFVPSGLKAFLQEPGADGCVSLRRVVCGGEALPADLQAWFASVLAADLFNVYGPTEAAVDVTSMRCPRKPEPGPVLIGRPVWNTRIYVLDDQRHHLPPGVTGELYIAGVQLAEGYLGQPELTAERFMADPYGAPGDRMYRSGDAARRRADGEIEFFGRIDHQVKIRGFRVELGEIESVLLGDEKLSQAVCVVREDVPGLQQLVAYVVPVARAVPDSAALRARAAAVLPDYMVPTAIVCLDSLPLTPNEKLDRGALPAPEFAAPAGLAPRTPAERLVADLFTKLLGVPAAGVEDEFFALGGNSLLASRLLNEIHEHSGVRLRLRKVLEDSSVQAIGRLITA